MREQSDQKKEDLQKRKQEYTTGCKEGMLGKAQQETCIMTISLEQISFLEKGMYSIGQKSNSFMYSLCDLWV